MSNAGLANIAVLEVMLLASMATEIRVKIVFIMLHFSSKSPWDKASKAGYYIDKRCKCKITRRTINHLVKILINSWGCEKTPQPPVCNNNTARSVCIHFYKVGHIQVDRYLIFLFIISSVFLLNFCYKTI